MGFAKSDFQMSVCEQLKATAISNPKWPGLKAPSGKLRPVTRTLSTRSPFAAAPTPPPLPPPTPLKSYLQTTHCATTATATVTPATPMRSLPGETATATKLISCQNHEPRLPTTSRSVGLNPNPPPYHSHLTPNLKTNNHSHFTNFVDTFFVIY